MIIIGVIGTSKVQMVKGKIEHLLIVLNLVMVPSLKDLRWTRVVMDQNGRHLLPYRSCQLTRLYPEFLFQEGFLFLSRLGKRINSMMNINDKIKARRLELGLTDTETAKKVGISIHHYFD